MSVQTNQYLGYGFMLPYSVLDVLQDKMSESELDELLDSFHDSAFNEKIVEIDGVSMLVDGMNGDFVFFGKVYAKSSDGFPLSTQKMPQVSLETQVLVSTQMRKYFGPQEVPAELMLITLYR